MTISVRSLLLCQLAEDADKLNDDVRLQLSIVRKEQSRARELIAEVADKRDAERYRWLRKCGSNWIATDVASEASMSQPYNYDWPNTLDATIDSLRELK